MVSSCVPIKNSTMQVLHHVLENRRLGEHDCTVYKASDTVTIRRTVCCKCVPHQWKYMWYNVFRISADGTCVQREAREFQSFTPCFNALEHRYCFVYERNFDPSSCQLNCNTSLFSAPSNGAKVPALTKVSSRKFLCMTCNDGYTISGNSSVITHYPAFRVLRTVIFPI